MHAGLRAHAGWSTTGQTTSTRYGQAPPPPPPLPTACTLPAKYEALDTLKPQGTGGWRAHIPPPHSPPGWLPCLQLIKDAVRQEKVVHTVRVAPVQPQWQQQQQQEKPRANLAVQPAGAQLGGMPWGRPADRGSYDRWVSHAAVRLLKPMHTRNP